MSAAEASGDEHAARLIQCLRKRLPEARFVGMAGPRMAAAGCEVLADVTRHASMLLGPVLRLGYYVRMVRKMQTAIRKIKPDLHIPVDSPAVNWHLCAAAKDAGAKVVYYIAPQVWAWAPWRVKKIARLTDHVACILPFEQKYLRERGVNATYVGHPLFDTLDPSPPRADLLEAWATGLWRVALLPGSRKAEIRGHSLAMSVASRAIRRQWPNAKCTFTARDENSAREIRLACGNNKVDIAVGRTRQILSEAHFTVAVSGTVTLEAAYFGVPMVVVYRTGPLPRILHRALGRWAVPTRYFSLVNVLARRSLVPELMPWHGSVKQLTAMVMEVMNDLGCLLDMRRSLLDVTAPLRVGPPGSASDNAADLIVDLLGKRNR